MLCVQTYDQSQMIFFLSFATQRLLHNYMSSTQSSLFKCWMLLTFYFINMFLIKCEKFLTSQEQLDINYHISPDGIFRSPAMHRQCV